MIVLIGICIIWLFYLVFLFFIVKVFIVRIFFSVLLVIVVVLVICVCVVLESFFNSDLNKVLLMMIVGKIIIIMRVSLGEIM